MSSNEIIFSSFFLLLFFISVRFFAQDTILVQDTIWARDTIKGILTDIKPIDSLIIDHKKIYLTVEFHNVIDVRLI